MEESQGGELGTPPDEPYHGGGGLGDGSKQGLDGGCASGVQQPGEYMEKLCMCSVRGLRRDMAR